MFDADVAWIIANARAQGYDYLVPEFEQYLELAASSARVDSVRVRDGYSRSCTELGTLIASAATWLREHDVPEPMIRRIISKSA